MNRKSLSIIIIIFTLSLIVGIYIFNRNKKYNSLVVSEDKWKEIIEKRENNTNIFIKNIKFNDYSALIDEENSILYYSMIDNDTKFNPTVSFKSDNNEKIIINEEITKEKIENNNKFKIMIYDDTKYHVYDLVVTSLPIVNITYDELTLKNNKIPTDVYIFDNRKNAHQRITKSKGDLNIIDNGYEKKDYSFSLLMDSLGMNERENNISILGMKKHSEYYLNSLYDDQEKVRNVFSLDLWNKMTDNKNDDSEYIELFINNKYIGLYSFGYNIEKDYLLLDQDEFLLFKNALIDSEKKYIDGEKLEGYTLYNKILNKQIKKRKEKKDCNSENCSNNGAFDELNNYYKNIFSNDINTIKDSSDLDSAMKIYLLYLFAQGTENINANTFANTYMLFKTNKNNYKVEYFPWNLSYTFGNSKKDNKVENYSIKNDDNSYIMKYNPIYQLLELKDEKTIKMFKEQYNKLRKNIINEENINKMIDVYEEKIFNSGAFIRDTLTWENSNKVEISIKLNDFREYVLNRIKYLDQYVESL